MNNKARQLCDEAYFAVSRRMHFLSPETGAHVAYDWVLTKTQQATTATDIAVRHALIRTIGWGPYTP